MNLKEFMESVVICLEKEDVQYALAGGMAASIYRAEERLTKDIDFLLLSEIHTRKKAEEIIESFGLTPRIAREADLAGGPMFAIKRKSTPPNIVVGTTKGDPRAIGLDFILPEVQWVNSALERAQLNRIDFGFAKIPTMTVEDVLIAKLHAMSPGKQRPKDVDDVQSILSVGHELDLSYLRDRIKAYSLWISPSLKNEMPKVLIKAAKQRL